MEFLLATLALGVGSLVGWIVAAQRAARARAELEQRLAQSNEARTRLETQLAERERAEERARASEAERKKQFEDAFGRMAQDALAKNSAVVTAAAEARFKPLAQQLEALQKKNEDLEKARVAAYATLDKQLTGLQQKTELLAQTSERMTTALSSSAQARGRWGEVALRNIVEAAGMTEHCDFETQVVLPDGTRPDMIVDLPDGTRIPIDAKAPLLDYQQSFDSKDEAQRAAALDKHARALRKHVTDLADRDYPSKMASRGFVVLFVPTDGALASAFERDPELYTLSTRRKVFLATPTSLLSILMSCKLVWQHKRDVDNANEIGAAARLLYERVVIYAGHVQKIGKHLEQARDAYGEAAGSYERRVLPTGRKLEEMTGAQGYKKLLPEAEAAAGDEP